MRNIRWIHVVVTLLGAVLAYAFVPLSMWAAISQPLTVALSVVGAGVLVRLARGVPFSISEELKLEEVRKLGIAINQSVRSLRVLSIFVFLTIGIVALCSPISNALGAGVSVSYSALIDSGISAFLGLSVSYVFVRLVSVVNGDIGLVELQIEYLETAAKRKNVSDFNDRVNEPLAPDSDKFPETYGKIIE